MEHVLKLQPKYFDYINNGTKRIELRLFDEKRKKIQELKKISDFITNSNNDLSFTIKNIIKKLST